MKNKSVGLNTQNKFILLGIILSTFLIVSIAIFVTTKIEAKLINSYNEFGKIVSKTLAIEGVEITKDIPAFEVVKTLQANAKSIINSNNDIAFIEFKNKDYEIIYSSKEDYPQRASMAKVTIDSPMMIRTEDNVELTGTVIVGMTGSTIYQVAKTTRNSLLVVFTLAWLVFTVAALVNALLITRELSLLLHGVQKISTGQFGYTLDTKSTNGDIKELYNAFNDMSTRLHKYEEQNVEQLTLERNKFEAVLMSIANGVVVCDNFDEIVLVNSAAKTLLEIENDDVLGTKIQEFYDTDGNLCFKEKISQFKDTPLDLMESKPLEFNIEISKKVLKAVISPMFSKNQDYVGYIIVLIDITKETEINTLKNHFISNVSHELRTPVTVLRTYIDTLYNHGDEFDNETQKEFMSVINKEATRLHKMVNDILDFSRLESPNVNLEKEDANILDIINNSINSLNVLAKEKNITFSVMTEPDLPLIPMNVSTIERVMNNLVSNAIKYSTNDSKIKIRAEIARDTRFVEVSVEDQGIGIPEEHHKKIFDRFYRVENETHTIKGTGLGLHLVKVSVEKYHNGEVFLKSKINEGSTFGFRLPLQQENDEQVIS
ncbi:PAS domain-containing protein [bacterium]|nr:PAS domain-containing protein [bacterium]